MGKSNRKMLLPYFSSHKIIFLVLCGLSLFLFTLSHGLRAPQFRLPQPRFLNSINNPRNGTISESVKTEKVNDETDVVASASSPGSTLDQYQLSYIQSMTAGAVSRSLAQTIMHPANTYKTLLQLKRKKGPAIPRKITWERLLRGVDAQFLLALPHGAFYFFVIDQVKITLSRIVPPKFDIIADFTSSAISTVICSVISTPQMVLTDRLMAGVYPSFKVALRSIYRKDGLRGFYTGWWPALAQKIPSYGLTWMFFQQFKKTYERMTKSKPNGETNFILGALAAAGSVTVMIPMDTVKTRLVIQMSAHPDAYKGMSDCFYRILKEEGIGAFYVSLPPRLVSVVPMIAIQFAVYETIKTKYRDSNRLEIRKRLAAIKNSSLSKVPSKIGLKGEKSRPV